MTVFLSAQLDFIFFLYGLAFILLGGVCLAMLDVPGRPSSYGLLGSFAILHGLSEWLDLLALLVGDTPEFATGRTVLMATSFALLLEFTRRQALQLGVKVPGPWIYLPLSLLLAAAGVLGGLSAANAAARYAIGFVAAAGTACVFVQHARGQSAAAKRLWRSAAGAFGAYSIAAGVIVPAANFWPANIVNAEWFTRLSGMPIQLVRGLLACWMATSLWLIWKRMVAADVDSPRYTASQQQILVWTLVATGVIVGLGWTLTELLGGINQRSVEEESAGDINLLASLLHRETAMLGGMVRAMAALPSVLPLVTGGSRHETDLAQTVLDREVAASGAISAYVVDTSGAVVASSGDQDSIRDGPRNYIAAGGDSQFAFNYRSASPYYYASGPVHDHAGTIVGTAVLAESLEALKTDLSGFNRSYFLVDPDGRVMATNRPQFSLPAPGPAMGAPGSSAGSPMIDRQIADATWITVSGQRHYVRRRFAEHSGWSLVLLMPASRVDASRFLGIIITLFVSIIMMIYLYGRERLIRDRVELENRLNMRDVARGLQLQATTDPLTGLFNRLKFNEMLSSEMARAKRHKTSFSLTLYDVDNFKAINDNHGHQVGDRVLVQISELVRGAIRPSDLVARWGGEEFIILAPGSDGQMAYQAAERLRAAMQQVVFGKVGMLSCSFGVSEYVAGDSAESMLARVDGALYRAKVGGRNRVELAA